MTSSLTKIKKAITSWTSYWTQQDKKEQENGGEKKGEDSQKDLDSILDNIKESENASEEEKKAPPPLEQPEIPKVEKPESTGPEPDGIEEILDSISSRFMSFVM